MAGMALSVALAVGVRGTDRPAYRLVTVQAGDTIWSLAESHYSDADLRAKVDEIERANGLASPSIAPGQVLKLPT